ncbi:MAG: hypothetical protein M3360_07285 [Actinomycetota bacterium]|nr:hypothetical protein [Actinomycetota bacterium]
MATRSHGRCSGHAISWQRTEIELKMLTPGMRKLFWIAGFLVFLAGMQLFVLTERTETWFAWTIDVPLTAAFLGAAYWSSVSFEWLAARRRVWACARIAVPTVLVFTTLTELVTLYHLELFHLGDTFPISTRAVTWAWIAIYSSVPLCMVALLVGQSRVTGQDPRRDPLPRWIAAILVVHAAMMLPLGAYLLVAPENASALWPWPLTPLTGRAVGAWVFGLGLAAAHCVRENCLERVRVATQSYIVLAVLEFIAVARYADTLDWSAPQSAVYMIVLLSMLVVGAAAQVGSRPGNACLSACSRNSG